jgi:dienelactone hydrolase
MRAIAIYLFTVAVFFGFAGSLGRAEEQNRPVAKIYFEQIYYQSKGLSLLGFISRPQGKGPFPAAIYNHGSGCRENGKLADLARFYVQHGWLYFAPVRHGHGGNPGRCIGEMMEETRGMSRDYAGVDARTIKVHELYNDDVVAAVEWLKQKPYVDPNRIIMTGISFGGIQTLLTTEKGLGIRAFIPCAPGAMSWRGSPALRERLAEAARQAKAPIFLIQAANDYNLGPSERLGPILDRKGPPDRYKVHPPWGQTTKAGHGFCGTGAGVYGDDLLAFLNDVLK